MIFIADLTPPPDLCPCSNGSAVLKTDVINSVEKIPARDMKYCCQYFTHRVLMIYKLELSSVSSSLPKSLFLVEYEYPSR